MGHSYSKQTQEMFELVETLKPHNDLEEQKVMADLEEERRYIRSSEPAYRKLTPVELRVMAIEEAISNTLVSGVSTEEIKRRMWQNWDYSPDMASVEWNDDCHPRYALMGEDEKTGRMWKTAMSYRFKGFRSSNDWNFARSASRLADRVKARYADWCLAQVVTTGKIGLPMVALTSKGALSDYVIWLRGGKRVPEVVRLLLGVDTA